jgi:hypothetical protein
MSEKVEARPDTRWWKEETELRYQRSIDRSHVPTGLRWVRFGRPPRDGPVSILDFPSEAEAPTDDSSRAEQTRPSGEET